MSTERPAQIRNVAVIGVGNLGFRHLESLYTSDLDVNLYAVDSSPAALVRAASLAGNGETGRAGRPVSCVSAIEQLPRTLDLVIVATNADMRLSVVERLLSHATVRSLVLEKVLFQRLEDYPVCEALLQKHGVGAFVNCPRRMYGIYRTINDLFRDRPIELMSVAGGNWGLACNSVHFVDLFQFLTGIAPAEYTLLLDPEFRNSKRPGFIEFTGTIHGVAAHSRLLLTAADGAFPKTYLTLFASEYSCVVDEAAGLARTFDQNELVEEIAFRVPWQSELTSIVARGLLSGDGCELPTYAEACRAHVPFIRAFLAYGRSHIDPALDTLPIT